MLKLNKKTQNRKTKNPEKDKSVNIFNNNSLLKITSKIQNIPFEGTYLQIKNNNKFLKRIHNKIYYNY